MRKTIYVNCSFCAGMMEVDVESGDIVKKWSPKQRGEENTMEGALKKLEEDKKRRLSLFEDKKEELEGQKKRIEDAFRKEVDRVKKEGVKDAPPRPFDLD